MATIFETLGTLESLNHPLPAQLGNLFFGGASQHSAAHLEAGVGKLRHAGALEGDEAGAVGGQGHQALVGQVGAVGQADVPQPGAVLGQLHDALVLDADGEKAKLDRIIVVADSNQSWALSVFFLFFFQ